MKRTGILTVALAVVAGLLPSASAAAHPDGRYEGVEYDQGGGIQAIDGRLPEVDRMADEITRSTDAMLRDVSRQRDRLRYGAVSDSTAGRPRLTTYPAPAGSPQSDQYAVSLTQHGRSTGSFVYQVAARKPDTNRELDTSWTSFAFAGSVTVTVHKLGGEATGCLVRPLSEHLHTSFAGNACSFTMNRAANVSVEFTPNTTNPVLHPMLVFANPPEVDVPPANDPDVLYLGPGFHHLGTVPLHSGQTVYVAAGAWVEANFTGRAVHDVVIRGRGVIDGGYLDTGDQDANKDQPGLIDIDCNSAEDPPHAACSTADNSSNILVDGLTFVNGPRFNVRVMGDHITVHNLKVMSWWFSTDCVWAGTASIVEGNFCKVNDDSLKPMTGNSVIRDNVVWQLENGAPFMISWNILTDQANFHVYDNDVIHAEHYQFSPQAVFRSRHATPGHLSRFLFEDIRVEDANWRLFYVILEKHPKWYDPALGFGQISGLIFRDITSTTQFTKPNVFLGGDPGHTVSDATLEDVFVNGTCAASATDGNFEIDPATTDRIRLVRSAHHPCGGH